MSGTLALFLPLYSRITWKVDLLALTAGVAIGVLWIAVSLGRSSGDGSLGTALAALPTGFFVSWVLLRIIGTVVLVPLVEELFFRGYVLTRLDQGGLAMRVLAISVSSGLFAALHERWVLAGIAGVVYGLCYLRRQQIADAIFAHAASNGLIAAYALATADWSLI